MYRVNDIVKVKLPYVTKAKIWNIVERDGMTFYALDINGKQVLVLDEHILSLEYRELSKDDINDQLDLILEYRKSGELSKIEEVKTFLSQNLKKEAYNF